MTKEVRESLDHVREFHPKVTHVVFNREGQWIYCDDNFHTPQFCDDIDVGILEDAVDSVEVFPSVFCIGIDQDIKIYWLPTIET